MEAGVRLGSVQKKGCVSNPIPIERSLASTALPISMHFIPKLVGWYIFQRQAQIKKRSAKLNFIQYYKII